MGAQENAMKAPKGTLRPGNANERGSGQLAEQGTRSGTGSRTGSQIGESRERQPGMSQDEPHKRHGFRTLRDVKAALRNVEPSSDHRQEGYYEEKYYQTVHCINAKVSLRDGYPFALACLVRSDGLGNTFLRRFSIIATRTKRR